MVAAMIGLSAAGLMTTPLPFIAIVAVGLFTARPPRAALFPACVAVLVLIPTLIGQEALHTERTFFGVLRVERIGSEHRFIHGTTLHGIENFAPGRLDEPLSYYSRQGPIGQVFGKLGDRINSVGAIGLGAGTIAAYGRPGGQFTFYEIDGAVARIASNPRYFTFLRDSKAHVRTVIGDGRLKIAAAANRSYDLVVLDAFSSDSVPVHLLTREAVELYLQKLRPNGLLAFHISNNYLDLKPVVGGIARSLGCIALVQDYVASRQQERRGASRSTWIVVARTERTLASLERDPRWTRLDQISGQPVWTDQFSNILSVLKWLNA
jgi:SAM-dependent methyltransferase